MAGISSREEFEAWLRGKPREVTIVMAARTALRVVPMVAGHKREDPTRHAGAFVLQQFRVLAASWFAGTWPSLREKNARAAFAAFSPSTSVAALANSSANPASAVHGTRIVADAAAAAAFAITAGGGARVAAFATAFAITAARTAASAEEVWQAIISDIEAIEGGLRPENLIRLPLWPRELPYWVQKVWPTLKSDLLALSQEWWVWTDWYEDRLRGTGDPATRPLIEDLERDRVLIDDAEWRKGAAHVNRLIAELERKYRGDDAGRVETAGPEEAREEIDVPAQRPGLVLVYSDEVGKVHRKRGGGGEGIDPRDEADLRAAWAAHRNKLARLDALQPGRNEPAFAEAMRAYMDALGDTFEDLDIIALGIHWFELEIWSENPGDILMLEAVNQLKGLVAPHHLFVRRFPRWTSYISELRDEAEPSDAAIEAAVDGVDAMADEPCLVDSDVIEPLRDLVNLTWKGALAAKELLHSVGNVMSGLVSGFFTRIGELGGAAWTGTVGGVEEGAKFLAKNALKAAALLGGGWALSLAGLLPKDFAWIKPAIEVLLKSFSG